MNPDIEKHLQNIFHSLDEVNVDHQSEAQLRNQILSAIHQHEQQIANQTIDEILNQTSHYLSILELFEISLDEKNKDIIGQLGNYPKIHFAFSFVQNIFDAIDNYQQLPQLLKHLIYQIRLPLLRLIINKTELVAQAKLPAIELINELIAYLVIWKDEKTYGYPTYTKLSQIIIFYTCNDDSLEKLFKNLITPIHTIREEQQKRSLVFEKRIKDTEQSAELKSSAKILVTALIQEMYDNYNIIPLVKEMVESSWQQLLELDVLRNDDKSFYSHLVALIMLVKSTQPINSKQELDWLMDNVEKINQAINKALERIGIISKKHLQLASQLELLHIDLIERSSHLTSEKDKQDFNLDNNNNNSEPEQILRLKPSGIFEPTRESQNELIEENSLPDLDIIEQEPQSIIEQVNLNLQSKTPVKNKFPSFEKLIRQYSLTERPNLEKTFEDIKSLSVKLGYWFLFEGENQLQKLLFTNHQTGDYIFVNQNGQKSYSIAADEFIEQLNNNKIRRFKPPNLHKKAIKASLIHIKKYLSDFHSRKPDNNNSVDIIDSENEKGTNLAKTELLLDEANEIETILSSDEKEINLQEEIVAPIVEPIETITKVVFSLQQISVGSWLKINHENKLIKCKMAARIASKDRYIFVDRSGKKLLEMKGEEIVQYHENGLLELVTIETNNESSLADLISKTRHLKNTTR